MKFNTVSLGGSNTIDTLDTNGSGLSTGKEYITDPDNVAGWRYNSIVEIWVPSPFHKATILKDAAGKECKIDVPGGDDHASITGSGGWVYSRSANGPLYYDTPVAGDDGYIRNQSHGNNGQYAKLTFTAVTSSATTQLLVLMWVKNDDDTVQATPEQTTYFMSAMNTNSGDHDPVWLVPGKDGETQPHVMGLGFSIENATTHGYIRNIMACATDRSNSLQGPFYYWSRLETYRTAKSNTDPFEYPYMYWLNAPSGSAKTMYAWIGNDLTQVGRLEHSASYELTGAATLPIVLESNEANLVKYNKFIILEA